MGMRGWGEGERWCWGRRFGKRGGNFDRMELQLSKWTRSLSHSASHSASHKRIHKLVWISLEEKMLLLLSGNLQQHISTSRR